jgi:hypothetical protein
MASEATGAFQAVPDLHTGDGVDTDLVERARHHDEDVIVMPLREQNGLGVYSQESLFLVKDLRSAGVRARFLHDSEARTFEVRKSAEALVGAIILSVVSNAAWDAIKVLFSRSKKDQQLKVTIVDLRDADGHEATSWTVDGDAEAVIRAIDRLKEEKQDEDRPPHDA